MRVHDSQACIQEDGCNKGVHRLYLGAYLVIPNWFQPCHPLMWISIILALFCFFNWAGCIDFFGCFGGCLGNWLCLFKC